MYAVQLVRTSRFYAWVEVDAADVLHARKLALAAAKADRVTGVLRWCDPVHGRAITLDVEVMP